MAVNAQRYQTEFLLARLQKAQRSDRSPYSLIIGSAQPRFRYFAQ
jgi:hypothetical protein